MSTQINKDKPCSTCESAIPRANRKILKTSASLHPDHSASKTRLNRIRGQLEAVSRMIDERKYCPEIIQQIRAASSALRSLEAEIFRGHLKGCVKSAFESKNAFEMNDKIEEIFQLLSK